MKVVLVLSIALGLTSCGENPFGSGSYSLKVFSDFAKRMEKPKSIHEEEGNKENSQQALEQAKKSASSLSRMSTNGLLVANEEKPWLLDEGFVAGEGQTFIYFQEFENKPSEEDSDKKETGRAEITFAYDGNVLDDDFDPTRILEVKSWSFLGYHQKTWIPGHKDSVDIFIHFSEGSLLEEIQPDSTFFHAWNISESKEAGLGDTAVFILDSLDNALKYQFGSGSFFDKYTGSEHNGPSRSFEFDLTVIHKNNEDESQPYLNYKDNEGIMEFELIYDEGEEPLKLFFSIHFYPAWKRTGEIYRVEGSQKILAGRFEYNEKSGEGKTEWLDEDGQVIDTDKD